MRSAAVECLEAVAHVWKLYPSVIVQSVVCQVVFVLYLALWVCTAAYSSRIPMLLGWQLVPMVMALYWTQQVCQNVSHVIASGVVAHWCVSADDAKGGGSSQSWPALATARRALTTSFGSICLGSLLVGTVRTLRATCVLLWQHSSHDLLLCLVRVVLAVIESIVEFVNQYAFAYVAAFGLSYFQSAASAWRLLRDRGVIALVNDSFVNTVTFCASCCAGLLGAVLAVGTSFPSAVVASTGWSVFFLGLLGFGCAYGACATVLETVEAGISALFMCLAEAPERLEKVRPQFYAAVAASYPGVLAMRGDAFVMV